MDIIRAPENIETMKETELKLESITLRVAEIREQQGLKIMKQFAGVQFCLFPIDLTCYDRYMDDADNTNELMDRLSYLKTICRSSHFATSIIMLVLTNAAACREQIATSPINCHFRDYTGGNNFDLAIKYIIKRCKQANKGTLPLFWHVHDLGKTEAEAMDKFFQQSTASIAAMSWLRESGITGH
jgi:hypothetical protein